MKLEEVKKKTLALIEELNEKSEYLTDDPDIQAKIHDVIHIVQTELARIKKIMIRTEEEVTSDEVFELNTLDGFYQLQSLRFRNAAGEDSDYDLIGNMVEFSEDGTAVIYYCKLPDEINSETKDSYEFELSDDALALLPLGAAGLLLKSDVSANYGAMYTNEYEKMLQRLDTRYATGTVRIEGGVDV